MGESSVNTCCAESADGKVSSDSTVYRKRRRHRQGRLYTFAVTTIAVFLFSLMVRPPAPIGYEWVSAIRHTVTGNREAADRMLAGDPSEELVVHCRQVMTTAGLQSDNPSAVQVQIVRDPDDTTTRTIHIRFYHAARETAEACLAATVDSYLKAHNRPDGEADLDARRDEATSHLRFWESRVAAIEGELTDLVQQEVDRQRSAQPATMEQVGEASTGASPPPHPTLVPNPRWEQLTRRFHEADIRLRGLQERFTDAHPHVIEAQRITASLEQALLTTPRFVDATNGALRTGELENERPAAEGPDLMAAAKVVTPVSPPDQEFDEQQARRTALALPLAISLDQSLQEAREKRRLAAETLQEVPPKGSSLAESAVIEQNPTLAKVHRAPVDRIYLGSILLPSVLLGAVITIPRLRLQVPPTLCSPADVEQSLQLPVYATLLTDDEPLVTESVASPLSIAVQRVVTACEFAIIATFVVLLVCAIVSPGFAQQAAHDPFGAIASALGRLGIY